MAVTNVVFVIKRRPYNFFFSCPFAKILWRIFYMNFDIHPPANVTNLFGNWLKGVTKKDKGLIRVVVCALLRAIWIVRNDFIFNKKSYTSFLQVIPLVTHWIHMWSYLQLAGERHDMDTGCNRLGTVARDFYSRCGWWPDWRITS
jgi:hypothetical protein